MQAYLDLVRSVLNHGTWKPNRTGIRAKTLPSALLRHSLSDGFPLLTTKKMAFHSMKVELESFIKGITCKKWLQERGCTIWNEWRSPKAELSEDDLGPIYGYQWRHFGADYVKAKAEPSLLNEGVDQLRSVVDSLKTHPTNRRMLVCAWNPLDMHLMALPPCHVLFHLVVIQKTLHLNWFQRSCDLMLGIPFNLASYALLLHLLAKEAALEEGSLSGMLSDVHIYENHLEGADEQLSRSPLPLPKIQTEPFHNIFEWEHSHTQLVDYTSHAKILFDVAI